MREGEITFVYFLSLNIEGSLERALLFRVYTEWLSFGIDIAVLIKKNILDDGTERYDF